MIDTVSELRNYIDVTPEEEKTIDNVGRQYPWRITEYFASLMDKDDRACPIRRQAVPSYEELETGYGQPDPLEEEDNSPVPGVIRVYPDRIAVIVTGRCPVYCRHCLRKRFRRTGTEDLVGSRLERVIDYIEQDDSIRDVLLTGGDPLMLSDDDLDVIMRRIREIPHVEILRIGTRVLSTWPERITDVFADMVAAHHPVWVSTQFNHPKELTSEAEKAVSILLKRGIPINNQSVLLRGINDSTDVMLSLVRKLVKIRIRPYYLYQAQTLTATGHFVTPIEKGLEIIKGLRGWTTGFAVPQYLLDTPYGKIPINPDYLIGRSGEYVEMKNYRGKLWCEWNPKHNGSSDH